MKVSLTWLKQYVDVPGSPAELAEHLTQLGLEVEGIETITGEFAGIVVAQVLTRDKHPNADKLSVCRVQDGQGERQIVCGAHNFQPGDKVPLILPGQALPPKPGETQPFVIKVGKIRGVESHGMMCSAEELGLHPEDYGLRREDGLLILKADAPVGQPLAEYLGRRSGDVIFDLEVTPNRPDLNSVIGIAREVAAVTGQKLRRPTPALPPGGEPVGGQLAVRVEAPDLCPRYTARIVRGVRIGPSPDWLRQTLEKVGLRSVNNVVDVTNFVMLETGQPLHAFDLQLIAREADGRPTLVIRRARDGETFTTLDGREHQLTAEHLLIADPEKGIALAGVMGGRNTEISDATTDVLVESAYFSPTGIRRTSKALGLRTDASYRFERGADIGAVDSASQRCVQLLLETAGGRACDGVVEVYPAPVGPRAIRLRYRRVNDLLGLTLPPLEIETLLGRLELEPTSARSGDEPPGDSVEIAIPSYRVDLKREVDLIEEIARMYGVERIPTTAPRGALGSHPFDQRHDALAHLRSILMGQGLSEVQGQTLISSRELPGESESTWVRLANPLSSDMDILRPSLLPGLLRILQHNAHRKIGDLQVFEVGRTLVRQNGSVIERWKLGLALTGHRTPAFWTGASRGEKCDLFDGKGILEELLERLGIRGVTWNPRPAPTSWFLESAEIALGGRLVLGELGQLHPVRARSLDLREAVLLAELDLETLFARARPERSFQPLPLHPAVRRDLAILVPEAVSHDAVLAAVRRAKPANLATVELFDVFRGKPVPSGHKSLAYAFTYRGTDRTLKEEEVNAAQARVVEALKSAVNAQLRD